MQFNLLEKNIKLLSSHQRKQRQRFHVEALHKMAFSQQTPQKAWNRVWKLRKFSLFCLKLQVRQQTQKIVEKRN